MAVQHTNDPVHHPAHYTSHPSGVECITITEHYNFLLGSVLKYLWRVDLKGTAIQDLEKAAWYLDREITRRKLSAELFEATRRSGEADAAVIL